MSSFETVRSILAEQLRVDESLITEDTNVMEDLGADSLDIVEMLMTIEADYGVTIPDDEVMNFKTVGDIARYLSDNMD